MKRGSKSKKKLSKAQRRGGTKKNTEKLPTSREVYNRLVWDAQYDAAAFVVGYQDHNRGLVRVPVPEFVPDGDIPWHRVWFFFDATGRAVWDRKERVYSLSSSTDHDAEAPHEAAQTPTEDVPIQPLECWRWSQTSGSWRSSQSMPNGAPTLSRPAGLVRVVSFNVLFDTFDTERIESPLRYRALLALLESMCADVIVLQEVTLPFLRLLLETPWVRAHYNITDIDGSTVTPYGQVILSIHPLHNVRAIVWTTDKRVVCADVHIAGTQPFCVAGLHLTSHRARHGRATRARQLRSLREAFHTSPHDVLLVGDFNCSDDRELEPLFEASFRDVWADVRPDDPGYTFDSDRNGLADWMSTQHSRCRYDRVLMRSQSRRLQPVWMRLLGEDALREGGRDRGLWLSDHFGLALLLSVPALHPPASTTTHKTALALVPPEDLWPAIQDIRREHDKSFHRWPPHINLLYGFLQHDQLPYAAEVLHDVAALFDPFELLLDGLQTFNHRGSSTVWITPHTLSDNLLESFQGALERLFPACTEQRRHGSFTPHLTVASLTKPNDPASFCTAHQNSLPPLSYTVSHLTILQRTHETPFETFAQIPLGQPEIPAPDLLTEPLKTNDLRSWLKANDMIQDPAQRRQRRELSSALRTHCTQAIAPLLSNPSPDLYARVVGSSRLGVSLPTSDLDLVCVVPRSIPLSTAQTTLEHALSSLENVQTLRTLTTQRTPVLKLATDLYEVDVQLTHKPTPKTSPSHAFQAIQDTDLIKSLASSLVDWKTFRTVLLAVRAWARAHDLDAPFAGLLPGISWAILLLWAARTPNFQAAAAQSPAHALAVFFRAVAAWNRTPVILTRRARSFVFRRNRDHMPIVTLSDPVFNTARNATRSTAHTMRTSWRQAAAQITRALDPTHNETWDTLFHADPLHDWRTRAESAQSALLVTFTLQPNTDQTEHIQRSLGAFRSFALTLVLRLESKHRARVRPFVHTAPKGSALMLGVLHTQAKLSVHAVRTTLNTALNTWRTTHEDACPVHLSIEVMDS